ncbi:hypothetical protein LA345_13030 [Burkholderia vietnamiensis]|uniref:Uncharacterized protein n=1 Tax=Burkholderia vietnamiensis (strain G4 / LMG 22486) TaxID=269482 RepID=A4JFM2_BURVG|nr:hypothetical protein Bcep1808_2073 [Burkholderia vietnamiensis G4]MCB4344836.1 hypothetical protein [Burkholderia vietnamiensis]
MNAKQGQHSIDLLEEILASLGARAEPSIDLDTSQFRDEIGELRPDVVFRFDINGSAKAATAIRRDEQEAIDPPLDPATARQFPDEQEEADPPLDHETA